MENNTTYLHSLWTELCQGTDKQISEKVFNELVDLYQSPARHYHNLIHIEAMLHLLQQNEASFEHRDAVYFACFFHDVVYNTNSRTNEEDSAEYAKEKLSQLAFQQELIEKVCHLILLTKAHVLGEGASLEEQLFVDADMAILGTSPAQYAEYAQQVRKEFGQFPEESYRLGRKKVLEHFMAQNFLYQSFWYREKFETQARENIHWELNTLAV